MDKKQYYLEHREKILAYQKEYYRQHREECLAKTKQWDEKHKVRNAEYLKKYFDGNMRDPENVRRGAILRKLRKEHGMRLKDVAEIIGISISACDHHETARIRFNPALYEPVYPGITKLIEERT